MKYKKKISQPQITVIIPTYNEEKNIKNTLLAVNNQIIRIPYEIIVVDGNSNDDTLKIAKQFSQVLLSPKKGKSYQLNYAVKKARGSIILFLDADTLVDPYFLHKIYGIFKKHKNLLACSARFKYYNGKAINFKIGNKHFILTSYFFQNIFVHTWYFFKTLLGYPELSGCNIIVRKEIFLKAGGFKQPPNSLGIDKVFSDSLLYLIKKFKLGKIKTLNFVSVLTSGRHLSLERSIKRIKQYYSQKDIYYKLARQIMEKT